MVKLKTLCYDEENINLTISTNSLDYSTCGLAEEQSQEGGVPKTTANATSSCGSVSKTFCFSS